METTEEDGTVTPEDLVAKARAVAGQLIGLPMYEVYDLMAEILRADPTLHALVRSHLLMLRPR